MGPRCCSCAASLGYREFVLAAIRPRCWNDDLTPWECPGLFADDAPFAGKAAEQLRLKARSSLASGGRAAQTRATRAGGLLACRAVRHVGLLQQRGVRARCECIGPAVVPEFRRLRRCERVRAQARLRILSLGSREARTPSRLLRNVAQGTRDVVELFEARGVPTVFEQNPGNHFKEPALRYGKGHRLGASSMTLLNHRQNNAMTHLLS